MQRRGTRLAILCLLLAAGALAGSAIWSADRTGRQFDAQRESKAATIERLLSSISAIASAQQAFADHGGRDVASFTRVSILIDRLTTDAAGLRAASESPISSQRLEEFWTALSALMSAEGRARERFAAGDEAGAADAILAPARDHVRVLGSSLSAFREAEQVHYRTARAGADWRLRASLFTLAGLWAAGLVAFAVLPWRREPPAVAEATPAARPPEEIPLPVAAPSPIDFKELADLCTELSRLSDQTALQGALARTAALTKARGIIVWIGAGPELFPVAAHGYDEALLARIRPIARDAENATADAWRSGELRRVPADSGGHGAIVAPLPGDAGCTGVLAVEVSEEREGDTAIAAVVAIVASQLSAVLGAGPASGAATIEAVPLDRKAAAS